MRTTCCITSPLPPLALLLLTTLHAAHAMQMDITFGQSKCFSEQVPRGATVYADFHVSTTKQSIPIDLFVTNEHGKVVAHQPTMSHHKFTIHPNPTDSLSNARSSSPFHTYRFCLLHQHNPQQLQTSDRARVTFSLKIGAGGLGANRNELVNLSHMQSAKERLRSLEDNVNNLMFRMDDLKAQEDALSNQNQSVASHLMAVSSLTSVLVLAVGVLQFDAVKHVLRKRHFIR